jgi:CMP-N-acetylneuraminic acid synthetase
MTDTSKKPLCIIPARGSSKRFPRKNVAQLCGKPLVAWTIEAALESGIFDVVWISSEDEEILRIAEEWGGKGLVRPPELALDDIEISPLCIRIVQDFIAKGADYTALYVLLPTSPLRTGKSIRSAWELFISSDAEALLSVAPHEPPPQWGVVIRDGWLRSLMPEFRNTPRIQLEKVYRPDGGHSIANIPYFLQTKHFVGEKTIAFFSPPEETVDVDNPLDLAFAEFLLQKR